MHAVHSLHAQAVHFLLTVTRRFLKSQCQVPHRQHPPWSQWLSYTASVWLCIGRSTRTGLVTSWWLPHSCHQRVVAARAGQEARGRTMGLPCTGASPWNGWHSFLLASLPCQGAWSPTCKCVCVCVCVLLGQPGGLLQSGRGEERLKAQTKTLASLTQQPSFQNKGW